MLGLKPIEDADNLTWQGTTRAPDVDTAKCVGLLFKTQSGQPRKGFFLFFSASKATGRQAGPPSQPHADGTTLACVS